MSGGDWSDAENDAIVASYFGMLRDELSGRNYVKSEQNRLLQEKIGRSRGSIEFKHCNISAAAIGFGLPIVTGYLPRFNFQFSLAEAISRWLARHPHWDIDSRPLNPDGFATPEPIYFGVPPTLQNSPPPVELDQLQAIAKRFDVAGRDERNRALGFAGEQRVYHHEQIMLRQSGRADLAGKVKWVSRDEGDGAGFDIASFTPDGRQRLIEVKTTNGWERTPFHISRNEIEVSRARSKEWTLVRLYDFAREPRAFELRPPLEAHVSLVATNFMASFQ